MSLALLEIGLLAFFLEILLQRLWILRMRRLRAEQVQKSYGPQRHLEEKAHTPSQGGVVFLAVALAAAVIAAFAGVASAGRILAVLVYPFLAAGIGFWDDFLKARRRSSEGLRSLQKLGAQLLATLPWALALSWGGLSLWPGRTLGTPYGTLLLTFLGVGMQNAVNVTDGLDGLAAGSVALSCAAGLFALGGAPEVLWLCSIGCACALAFLWHNSHPASIFMGDVGAHFLAGVLVSACAFSGRLAAIIPLGFLFGIEMVSVTLQIIAIRGFGRRIFRMSPLHHHFELLGWSETWIVARFQLIHLVGLTLGMALLIRMLPAP
jgi:phospho-N-acetylmuramoyl-pentapeptide-transferase